MKFPDLRTCNIQLVLFLILTVFPCRIANDPFQNVSLTCTFLEDTGKIRGFKIAAGLSAGEETALKCFWKTQILFCFVAEGYSYDWKLSDTVTVRRNSYLEPQPSTCSCVLVYNNETSYERPCSVQVSLPNGSILEPPDQSRKFPESSHPSNIKTKDLSTDIPHSLLSDRRFIALVVLMAVLVVLTAAFSLYRLPQTEAI